ncbi:MAG: hypothetical protein M0T84_14550 [Betaproteobacteria bacterium]|nr:hypothetical protein [Betaproteobacteria bacterium]
MTRRRLGTKRICTIALMCAAAGGTAQAHASTAIGLDPILNFNFNGSFSMYDSTGALVGGDNTLSGSIHLDTATFGGTATMSDPSPFFGSHWYAHDIQISATPDLANGSFLANSHMLFDWGPATTATSCGVAVCDYSIYTQFQIAPTVNLHLASWTSLTSGTPFNVTTTDADGDGIPGNQITYGPFKGFSPAFDGTATFQAISLGYIANDNIPPVDPTPLPGTALLLGSGLLGMVSVARTRKASLRRASA